MSIHSEGQCKVCRSNDGRSEIHSSFWRKPHSSCLGCGCLEGRLQDERSGFRRAGYSGKHLDPTPPPLLGLPPQALPSSPLTPSEECGGWSWETRGGVWGPPALRRQPHPSRPPGQLAAPPGRPGHPGEMSPLLPSDRAHRRVDPGQAAPGA